MAQLSDPSSTSVETKVTFSEKTARIRALGQFIKSITPLIWTAVILIVFIPLIGRFLVDQSQPQPDIVNSMNLPEEVIVESVPDFNQIDAATANAIQEAHQIAEKFAISELNEWHREMVPRVNSFLDWYFNYFNQKGMEFKAPFIWARSAVVHQFNSQTPTGNEAVVEQLTESFQREFSKRVLVPRNAQIKLENIIPIQNEVEQNKRYC